MSCVLLLECVSLHMASSTVLTHNSCCSTMSTLLAHLDRHVIACHFLDCCQPFCVVHGLSLCAHSSNLLLNSWEALGCSLRRVIVLYLVPTVYRFKYYFAWAVAESGLTLSGFNYNGKDKRGVLLWDRYVNARIRHVECQTSLAKLPEHWNVCTGLFLRQCKCTNPQHMHCSTCMKSMLLLMSAGHPCSVSAMLLLICHPALPFKSLEGVPSSYTEAPSCDHGSANMLLLILMTLFVAECICYSALHFMSMKVVLSLKHKSTFM